MSEFELGPSEVHVWYLPVAEPPGPDASALLSADEQARAARFRFRRDRDRYVGTRAQVRRLLSAYLSAFRANRIRFGYGEHGKPSLERPRSSDLRFNWSHASDWAALAVTRGAEVGIDLEHESRIEEIDRLAKLVFSPGELAAFLRQPSSGRRRAFFNGWTRKEAFIKATGEGLSRRLASFDVTLDPGAAARILSIDGDTARAERWSLLDLKAAPAYVGAVVVAAPGFRVRQATRYAP